MATFITVGYGDRAGYEQTEASGGTRPTRTIAAEPVQVRNHDDGGIRTTRGPFMRSDLPIAGFAIIEAANADDAVGSPFYSVIMILKPC